MMTVKQQCRTMRHKQQVSSNSGSEAMMARPNADSAARVVEQTADRALLEQPLRSQADIEAIKHVPLRERLRFDDFCQRIDLAIAAREPRETAIHYVEDGDVNRQADE